MEDIEVMVKALKTMQEVLSQGKYSDSLNKSAQEILGTNIAELSDIIVRYCKENYDA